nr:toll/interleukin-1 receptor domain-containing protein [Methanobrevibacter arboriphilus]
MSHATEDKERFVEEFAKKLRKDGIDAWYDNWEMNAGDSLTEKVFEAIGNCDFFIVILSPISIKKPWVKEELNAALMQKIKGKLKLIPIPIDSDVGIPISIDHLYRFNMSNTKDYEEQYQNLVMDIFGITKKPPLGERPSYITDRIHLDLEDVDFLIFETLGNMTKNEGLNFEIIGMNLNELLKNIHYLKK